MTYTTNWQPLEAALPLDECGDWMHMGTVQTPDAPPIEQYKHSDTRAYVNLALTDRGVQAFAVQYGRVDDRPSVRSLRDDPTALLRERASWL